jgi:hypothetical protein
MKDKPKLDKVFIANGNKYYIMDYITIGREAIFKNTVAKMAFGVDFKELFQVISSAYKDCTTGESPISQLNKAGVKLLNLLEAIKNIKEKGYDPYLELCALFINLENEDHSTITESQIENKINDWIAEGFDPNDFFLLAINSVKDLKSHYQELKEIL